MSYSPCNLNIILNEKIFLKNQEPILVLSHLISTKKLKTEQGYVKKIVSVIVIYDKINKCI